MSSRGPLALFPAIDLRGGRCVRLQQGDYARETVYDGDPVAVAGAYATAGAPWVHVVDLDAARTGVAVHRDVVAAIASTVPVPVQTGGGVRTAAAAATLLGAGVARVVVGTAAIEDPALVDALVAAHPGQIAVGLDARGREVATHGWTAATGQDLLELARGFASRGVTALVVTEIGRDGTMTGPDLEQLGAVLAAVGGDVDVVASGGVGTIDDLRALAALEREGHRLAGAIVGRALYEGRFRIEEAIVACSRPE